MATNTNYTTKTAALKATKADMRQVQVSKKIEIGSTDTKTIIQDGSVSAEDLLVSVEGKDERQSVKSLIQDVSTKVDNMKMGIDIGTDSSESPEDNPESGVTNAPAAFSAVSKLNFRGSYVTVVEDPVTKEVTLWINKSTAYPDYDTDTPFDMDTTSKENNKVVTTQTLSTSAVKLFTPPSDNNYTCTSGTNVNAVLVKDAATFGKTFYKLRTANELETFRVSSTQALFIRTTYNGTAGDWKKIDFGTKAGRTHTIGQGYAEGVTASPFSGSSYATIGTTSDALYIRYSVQPFTSAQAPDGRVPNTSEAEVNMIIDWDALLTLDGGTATVEYAFAPNTTTDLTKLTPVKLVDKFFTEYKVATVDSISVAYDSQSLSGNVSGLKYATTGTKVKVNATGIKNTQWKSSNQNDTRIVIDAAGSSTDVTAKVSDCTLSSGSATGSDAVYNYTMPSATTITAGSTNTTNTNGDGVLKVTVTPYSTSAGTAKTDDTTLKGFWGSIPKYTSGNSTNDGDKKEPFGDESQFRMAKVDSAEGTYDSSAAVNAETMLASIPGTSYTNLVQAVCQYGQLKHPKNAKVQYDGTTPYSDITTDAVFIRKFKASGTGGFTLSGTNIGTAKAVYWYDGATYNLISTAKTGVYEPSTNSIKVTWSAALHQPISTSGRNIMIIIVMGSGNSNIGALTLA
ncbi:MAG: hypothetical protein J6R59_01385 [Paludibacteraceae bacterium]|nr:hypothetical protein [Paludibacteraceae bacterium]